MKIIPRCIGMLALLVLPGVCRANALTWAVSTGAWSNDNNTALLYSSNPSQDGLSYLVQLIWAGANGVADPVTNTTTTGVSGDDQVVASAWMGLNVPNPIRLGKFTSGSTPYNNTHADGQELYIRAWEQPDNGASNGIPVSLAAGTWYGNSTLHAITDFTSGNPESFEAGGSQPSWFQIVAIPEPGTCAFLAAGLVLMLSRRMIQRWRN